MAAIAAADSVKLQTRWIVQGMFDNPRLAALIASGAFNTKTFKEAYPDINGFKPGQVLTIPQFSSAPDFSRVDRSSTGDRSFTDVSAYTQSFPIISDSSDQSWNRYDELSTGESFKGSFEQTVGNKMAKRLLGQTGRILSGALKSASPSLTADYTGNKLNVQRLVAAKAIAGDQGENLTVLIAHSRVLNDLLNDLTQNQKYNVLSGQYLLDGQIKNVLGIDYVIPSDQMPVTSAAFPSVSDDIYESFLLRGGMAGGIDGAMFLGYQEEMKYEYFELPTKEVSKRYIRNYMEYVLAPRGFTYSAATTNPTDANLADSTKWTEQTEDARNIGAIRILSAGYGGL